MFMELITKIVRLLHQLESTVESTYSWIQLGEDL